MAESTALVLAAGGITLANELLFAPAAGVKGVSFNWRIIPATAGLAIVLGAMEKIVPQFAIGLAGLTLLGSLIIQVGKAPTPLDNLLKVMGYK